MSKHGGGSMTLAKRGKTLKLGHVWVQKIGAIGRFKERFCVLTTNNQLEYYQKQEAPTSYLFLFVLPLLF
jgi:hypothetical protein